jgi:hypothetical protein
VNQWERDINTVWSNAEACNGRDSFPSHLAQRIAWKFQHRKKPLDTYSVSGRTKHIYGLRDRFGQLLAFCPPLLQAIIPRSLDNAMPIIPSFSTQEIGEFMMKASEKVRKPKDIEQIYAILGKNDPPLEAPINVDDDIVVDVNLLSPQTLHPIDNAY